MWLLLEGSLGTSDAFVNEKPFRCGRCGLKAKRERRGEWRSSC